MTVSRRLGYIDWARGLAVYLMIQTHAYSSWLSPEAKQTRFWHRVELIGGYPAPLFLFLAGMGLALMAEALGGRGRGPAAIAREGVRRGLQVFGYAVLFSLSGLLALAAFAVVLFIADVPPSVPAGPRKFSGTLESGE